MKMLKFRAKQWTGENVSEMKEFIDFWPVLSLGPQFDDLLRILVASPRFNFHGTKIPARELTIDKGRWLVKVDADHFVVRDESEEIVEFPIVKWTGSKISQANMEELLNRKVLVGEKQALFIEGASKVRGKFHGYVSEPDQIKLNDGLILPRGVSIVKADKYFIVYKDNDYVKAVKHHLCVE